MLMDHESGMSVHAIEPSLSHHQLQNFVVSGCDGNFGDAPINLIGWLWGVAVVSFLTWRGIHVAATFWGRHNKNEATARGANVQLNLTMVSRC